MTYCERTHIFICPSTFQRDKGTSSLKAALRCIEGFDLTLNPFGLVRQTYEKWQPSQTHLKTIAETVTYVFCWHDKADFFNFDKAAEEIWGSRRSSKHSETGLYSLQRLMCWFAPDPPVLNINIVSTSKTSNTQYHLLIIIRYVEKTCYSTTDWSSRMLDSMWGEVIWWESWLHPWLMADYLRKHEEWALGKCQSSHSDCLQCA